MSSTTRNPQKDIFATVCRGGILTFACLLSFACTNLNPKRDNTTPLPQSRVFLAAHDEVERAIKQALIKYPQRIDNLEAGIYETDYVKGAARFVTPGQEKPLPNGFKYRLLIRMLKGKSEGKPAYRVSVTKEIEIARSFFQDASVLASDGYEELTVLYRIQREIAMDRAIKRAAEKSNQAPGANSPDSADGELKLD